MNPPAGSPPLPASGWPQSHPAKLEIATALQAISFWVQLQQISKDGVATSMDYVRRTSPDLSTLLHALMPELTLAGAAPEGRDPSAQLWKLLVGNLGVAPPEQAPAGAPSPDHNPGLLAGASLTLTGALSALPHCTAPGPPPHQPYDVRSTHGAFSVPPPAPTLALESGASSDRTTEYSEGSEGAGGRKRSATDTGAGDGSRACSNCGTTSTPFWRKERFSGLPLCNACGLYASKNDHARPAKLWRETHLSGHYPTHYVEPPKNRPRLTCPGSGPAPQPSSAPTAPGLAAVNKPSAHVASRSRLEQLLGALGPQLPRPTDAASGPSVEAPPPPHLPSGAAAALTALNPLSAYLSQHRGDFLGAQSAADAPAGGSDYPPPPPPPEGVHTAPYQPRPAHQQQRQQQPALPWPSAPQNEVLHRSLAALARRA